MNEQLKFYKGNEENLQDINPQVGSIYHCEDTGNTYLANEDSELEIYSNTFTFSDAEADFTVPVNADTLNGKTADDFMTPIQVDDAINEAVENVAYVNNLTNDTSLILADAESLGGLPAENYATKIYVSDAINQAQLGGDNSEIDLSIYATKDDLTLVRNAIPTTPEAIGAEASGAAENALNNAKTYTNEQINAIDFPVDSVNGKTGDVSLSAADVGARPNTWMPTSTDIGARPNTWTPTAGEVGAAPMEYAKKVGNPHNLLDNSDFTNPVNLLGFVSGSTVQPSAQIIDRWSNYYISAQTLFLDANGISGFTTDGEIEQLVNLSTMVGKKVTIAAYSDFGSPIHCASGEVVNTDEWSGIAWSTNWEVNLTCRGKNVWYFALRVPCKYVAIYEGEYTIDTLPEYQPKGYAVELVACNVLETEHLSGSKVLWMNASPNSSFAAQTITVPHLNEYNAVMVVFENTEGGAGNYAHLALKEAMGTWWCDVTNARYDGSAIYVVTRRVTVDFGMNIITFESGSQNGVEKNMRGIPYAVYGLQRG